MLGLLYDTETTGLWDFKSPEDASHQPHIVQLAFKLVSFKEERTLLTFSAIIRPKLYNAIPEKSAQIHGIDLHRAIAHGVSIEGAMKLFNLAASQADIIIAHNNAFDSKLIARTCSALDIENVMESKPQLCTMVHMTNALRLPSRIPGKFKWPTLTELYKFFFGADFSGAHDAMVDVNALERCFIAMINEGHYELS